MNIAFSHVLIGMCESSKTVPTVAVKVLRQAEQQYSPGRALHLVSLRDLILHDLNEKDDEVRMMRAYIQAYPET